MSSEPEAGEAGPSLNGTLPQPLSHNDNRRRQAGARLFQDVIMGVRFFSRLPSGNSPHLVPDLARIARALGLASLLIGILPALVLAGGLALGLPGLYAGGIAVGVAIFISGAMSEDGLADAMDGLFGGHSPARRLEIMKDSQHGTYGVVTLTLFVLLRVAALGALTPGHPLAAAALWLAAMILARSGSLWLSCALPNARGTGLSASVGRVDTRAFLVGVGGAVTLALVLSVPFGRPMGLLGAIVLAGLLAWGWTRLCQARVGGQTGDLIGALGALIEIAALGAFLALGPFRF